MKKIFIWLLALLFFVPMEAGAEIRSSLQQARLAYICALADMAVYDTDMNDVVRQEMDRLGWRFTDYRNKDARANTVFYTVVNMQAEPGQRETLIVIPGTEKLKDIEVDLRCSKVLFGGSSINEFRQYAEQEKVDSNAPMVHRGFNDYTMTAFFTPRESGKIAADEIQKFLSESNDHLYITGHSLGGAVATLLGARLVAAGADASKLSIVTFGAPTVGNTAFAEEYGCLLDVSRYTMSGDLVKNALQMLKSGYVQFGTEYKWQKNENSHRFNHSMAGYLDAAIRGYYDESLGGVLTLQQLASYKPETINEEGMATGPLWNQQFDKGRVYIAPVQMKLPENIQNDSAYMQLAVGDLLMNQFQRIHVDENAVAASNEVDTLFTACQEAEQAGCEYIAQIKISGTMDKANPNLYRIATETSFFTTSGEPLASSMTSTTTKEITPIEAAMYNMARLTGDIQQAQAEGILPK